MEIKVLPDELIICQVLDIKEIDLNHDFYFISKTCDEISLVCKKKR